MTLEERIAEIKQQYSHFSDGKAYMIIVLCRALEEALYWIDNGVWVQGAQGIRDELAAILDGKESD